EILDRSRGEEIFLAQAQFLAGWGRVRGIEHAGDDLGAVLLAECRAIVAAIEGIELDRIDGAGMPQSQGIHMLAAPADDRRIVADRHDFLGRRPAIPRRLTLAFRRNRPAEAYFVGR